MRRMGLMGRMGLMNAGNTGNTGNAMLKKAGFLSNRPGTCS